MDWMMDETGIPPISVEVVSVLVVYTFWLSPSIVITFVVVVVVVVEVKVVLAVSVVPFWQLNPPMHLGIPMGFL